MHATSVEAGTAEADPPLVFDQFPLVSQALLEAPVQ